MATLFNSKKGGDRGPLWGARARRAGTSPREPGRPSSSSKWRPRRGGARPARLVWARRRLGEWLLPGTGVPAPRRWLPDSTDASSRRTLLTSQQEQRAGRGKHKRRTTRRGNRKYVTAVRPLRP
ncbi:hypothetical protein NDU88_005786 [Pleurodeles waltl]|uniref:Uncharacterized protein n=1 Tax=Pleurodeles waltl TaxID=8319 RepID=A0AAV7L3N7_PLEWA|nr:hypothetical protein NDU88_005786 [Pleurodeles waltl]